MTPQHLRDEGDSTHTAISIYLQTLNTFSQGYVRQDPGVNSKKKPHSEEEEKEEEQWEEEEVATTLYGNDVSHEHVDMNACDHSKQGLETQIASEIHYDPESEVTDSCESFKNVQDDIEKDVTDVTGQKEVMGGSEHSQNEFAHKNTDMNANDQSKQGLETEIGAENPNVPESEGTDGGNVGTDIISPREGASDDKSDEPLVLPSSPPPNGKIIAYQKCLEKNKKKRKRKEKRKRNKKKKKSKREIEEHYFLPQRTGLEICHLELPANFSTRFFFHVHAPLCSK
jgi:hypothetical protein